MDLSGNMPATWSTLPAEIRTQIIEYVVANKTFYYIPCRTTTDRPAKGTMVQTLRLARLARVLLVSKQFLTYTELKAAIFKAAVVKCQPGPDLVALNARFSKGNFLNIKNLYLTADFCNVARKRRTLVIMPPSVERSLTRLETVTLAIKDYGWAPSFLHTSNLILLRLLASGRDFAEYPSDPNSPTSEAIKFARHQLQTYLDEYILGLGSATRFERKIYPFLMPAVQKPYERVFRMQTEPRENDTIEEIEFVSTLRCCRLVNHPSILLPQRMDEFLVGRYPGLVAVNEVPLGKYYVKQEKLNKTKGEAAEGEVAKGEVAKGEVAKGEVAKGEVAKGEAAKEA